MERVDIACGTSMLNEWRGINDTSPETWPILDYNTAGKHEFAKAGSVGCCSRCRVEVMSSENDADSGIVQVEHCSSEKSAASMVDVACGSDWSPAAAAAGVIDAADAGCAVKDNLQTPDNNVLLQDQFDRHTIDLLAFLALLLARYNIIHYTVCILGLGMLILMISYY